MMNEKRAAVVLAAGKGKRMNSDLPKVLHPIAGKPIIDHEISTLLSMELEKIVVIIGHGGEEVQRHLEETFPDAPLTFRWQRKLLGTGHAVMMAEPDLKDFTGSVLALAGDVPFISEKSLNALYTKRSETGGGAVCLSAIFEDATGYGRVVRAGGMGSDRLLRIVEHKDADEAALAIDEINSGIFVFDGPGLFKALKQVGSDNAQGEYYLTDVIEIMNSENQPCFVVVADNPNEVCGINSIEQLKTLETLFSETT
ncbi:NTP transferase domain-containing protein [Gemmatimonas aurantiaca]|nr:NTP transferase domain-containing protein [Gemmatimonas aurantiaca]